MREPAARLTGFWKQKAQLATRKALNGVPQSKILTYSHMYKGEVPLKYLRNWQF